jgi:WD40 repeat protein
MKHISTAKFRIFLTTHCLLVFSILNGLVAQEPLRKWRAASGGFSIEAFLVEVQTDKVQLKKKDGTVVTVEVRKLSQEDIEFIKQWQKQQLSDSNDAKPKKATSKADTTQSVKSEADRVAMQDKDRSETVTRKTIPKKDRTNSETELAILKDLDLFVGPVATWELTIPATKSHFIGWHHADKSGPKGYVVDLSNGTTCKPFSITTAIQGDALSPDGQLFAFLAGQRPEITIYSTDSGAILYQFLVNEFSGIGSIEFLSSQELMVVGNSKGTGAAVYDVKKGRFLRWLDIPTTASRYEVSSDGKLLVLHQGQDVFRIVDTKTGKAKAEVKLEGDKDYAIPTVQDLSFCNQDRDVGVLCMGRDCGFRIYDVKTGKLKVKHSLTKSLQQIAYAWEDHKGPAIEALPESKGWLLYGLAVVDPKLGGPVWIETPRGPLATSIIRPLIDHETQLILESDRLKTIKLPWAEIEQSRQTYK